MKMNLQVRKIETIKQFRLFLTLYNIMLKERENFIVGDTDMGISTDLPVLYKEFKKENSIVLGLYDEKLESSEKLVGFMCGHIENKDFFIVGMYTKEDYRNSSGLFLLIRNMKKLIIPCKVETYTTFSKSSYISKYLEKYGAEVVSILYKGKV